MGQQKTDLYARVGLRGPSAESLRLSLEPAPEKKGVTVAATLRKVNALDDLKAKFCDDLWVTSLYVTDAKAVRRVVDRAFATMGRIDVGTCATRPL